MPQLLILVVPSLPQEVFFPTLFALSDARLRQLHQKVILDPTGFGGHVALSHSGILWIKSRASSYTPEGRDEHPWAQVIMQVQSAKYTQDHLGPMVLFLML